MSDPKDQVDPTARPSAQRRAAGDELGGADQKTDELARLRAELARARADLDVFAQLTSGYWWFATVPDPEDGALAERRVWVSAAFLRATGYGADELARLEGDAIHPDDRETAATVLRAVIRGRDRGGREQAVHDFRIFAHDGSTLWVRRRIEGRGTALRRVYVVGDLITERKRTEDALGHAEARFLSLVEHAPNVIVTTDLAGTILFVNRQVPGDGREPWELIGSSVFALADMPGRERLRESIAGIARTGSAGEFALRGAVEPGRWYEVHAAPVIRSSEVAAITMILTDVTARRAADEALRRSESRWRFLWENVPDRITELDAEGRIVVSNRPLGDRPVAELYGASVFSQLSPEAATALRRAIRVAQRTGEAASYEIAERDPLSRRETWWANRVVPFVDDESPGFLLIGADISERKAAERERASLEAQLRQQQKLESIGTLASGVAHEINNPIQSIMNYADLVHARSEPDGPVADFAREIVAETERVANIVRSLLAFARQEREHHSPARLADIVDSSLTLMRAVLRRDHIQLQVDVPEDLPKIKCRSQQIQQVFMNLFGNARDALNARYPEFHEDKRIFVVAREHERDGEAWVRATVEDRGIGIAPEILDRIFDPFFTTKGRDEGTGLGLSVSHGIVREHGGEFEVESEAGRHTRFHLNLRVDNGWERSGDGED